MSATKKPGQAGELVVRVIGAHPVLGHEPGSEFHPTDVPPEQLARLIARGSLHVIQPARDDVADDTKE